MHTVQPTTNAQTSNNIYSSGSALPLLERDIEREYDYYLDYDKAEVVPCFTSSPINSGPTMNHHHVMVEIDEGG